MRIAGNIAIGVGPSTKDFWPDFRRQISRKPPNVKVDVAPDLTKLRALIGLERRRQEANPINLRVRLDQKSVRRAETGLRRIEHTWKQSDFQRAIRVNLYVAGAASLPGLIQGIASLTTGITELSRAALVLPGALAGVGAAFSTAAVGIRGVSEALQESGRAMDNASRKARLFREASRELERAQRDIVDALKAANREIEDQQDKLTRNQLSVEQAQLNLQRANQALARGGFQTVTDWRQAVLDQRQAQLDLNTTLKQSRRDIQDYYDTSKGGATQTETFKEAVDRLASSMEDYNKKLLESTGASEKFLDAMRNLSPAARDFVNQVRTLGAAWKGLQNSVQDNLFRGLGDAVVDLANRRLPLLQKSMNGVAKSLNADIKQVLDSIGNDQNSDALAKIFDNTAIALDRMRPGLDSLITGVIRLSEVGSRFLPRLSGAFNSLMERFELFIARADADGSLERWIDSGLRTVSSLGRSFKELFSIFGSVTSAYQKATGNLGGIVTTIERSLKGVASYFASPRGQAALVNWIATAREFMATLSESLPGIRKLFGAIGDSARAFAEDIFPVFSFLGETLERHIGLVKRVFFAWAAWRTFAPVQRSISKFFNTFITGYQKYNEVLANSILNSDKEYQRDVRSINTKKKLKAAIKEARDEQAAELQLRKDALAVDVRNQKLANRAVSQQAKANAETKKLNDSRLIQMNNIVGGTRRQGEASIADARRAADADRKAVRQQRLNLIRARRAEELSLGFLNDYGVSDLDPTVVESARERRAATPGRRGPAVDTATAASELNDVRAQLREAELERQKASRVVELNREYLDENSYMGGDRGRDASNLRTTSTGRIQDTSTGKFVSKNPNQIGIDAGPLDNQARSKDIIPRLRRERTAMRAEIKVLGEQITKGTFSSADEARAAVRRFEDLQNNVDAYTAAIEGNAEKGREIAADLYTDSVEVEKKRIADVEKLRAKERAAQERFADAIDDDRQRDWDNAQESTKRRIKAEQDLEAAETKAAKSRAHQNAVENKAAYDNLKAESDRAALKRQNTEADVDGQRRMVEAREIREETDRRVAKSTDGVAKAQKRLGELDDAMVQKKGIIRRGWDRVRDGMSNVIARHQSLTVAADKTTAAYGKLRTSIDKVYGKMGGLRRVMGSRGGGGFIGLMGAGVSAVGGLVRAVGGLGTLGLIYALDKLATAQQAAGDRAAYHRNQMLSLKNALDDTTGVTTLEGLNQAIRSGQEYEVTGKDNNTIKVDAVQAAADAGIPVELLRRSLDPTQIEAINEVQRELDAQTLSAVLAGKDYQWNKFGERLSRHGVTAEVYAKALNGDEEATKKFEKAKDKIFSDSPFGMFGGDTGPGAFINRGIAEQLGQLPDLGSGAENLINAGVDSVAASQFQRESLLGNTQGAEETKRRGNEAVLKPGSPFPGAEEVRWDDSGTTVGFVMNNLTPGQVRYLQELGAQPIPTGDPNRYGFRIGGDLVDQWVVPRGYATGGPVWGAGSATSDSIPALLSNGEYVINARSASIIGQGNLDRLNSVQRFAPGGPVKPNPTLDDIAPLDTGDKFTPPEPGAPLAETWLNAAKSAGSMAGKAAGAVGNFFKAALGIGDPPPGYEETRIATIVPNSVKYRPKPKSAMSTALNAPFSADTVPRTSGSGLPAILGNISGSSSLSKPWGVDPATGNPWDGSPKPPPPKKGPVVSKPKELPHMGAGGAGGPGGKRSSAGNAPDIGAGMERVGGNPYAPKPRTTSEPLAVRSGDIPTYEQLPSSGNLTFDVTDPSLSPPGAVAAGGPSVPTTLQTANGPVTLSGSAAERMSQFAAIADFIPYDQGQQSGNNFNLQGIDCTGLALAFANIGLGKGPFDGGRVGLGPEGAFWTGNLGSELTLRGFKPGFVPGALNIGWNHNNNSQHAGMTLPDGTRIDAQNVANGVVVNGTSPGADSFGTVMHLPIELMNASSPFVPTILPSPQNTPGGPIPTIPDISTAMPPPGAVTGGGGGMGIPGVNAPIAGPYGELPVQPFDILREIGEAILGAILGFFGIDISAISDTINNIFGGMPDLQQQNVGDAGIIPEDNPNPNIDPGPDNSVIDQLTALAAQAKAAGNEDLARNYLARAAEYRRSRMAASAPPSTLGSLTLDSSQSDVAKAILSEARSRGYTKEQAQAILATAIYESGGLNPAGLTDTGQWRGIFRNPSDDPVVGAINDPNYSIAAFFDRLDQKAIGGGDIFDTIYWLQNKPEAANIADAKKDADLSYLQAIREPSVLNSAKTYMEAIGYSRGGPVGFNTGGGVERDLGGIGTASEMIAFAESQAKGQPYVYGGYGAEPGTWVDPDGRISQKSGYDCSGITGSIWANAFGLPPSAAHYFNTESDFEALGFIPGSKPGAYNIGVMRGGGGPNSHMAATLPNGVSVESAGSKGTVIGDAASPADSFPMQWHLPVDDTEMGKVFNKGVGGVLAGYFLGRSLDPNQFLGYKDGGFARTGPDGFEHDPWPFLDKMYGSNLPGNAFLWEHGVMSGQDPMNNANGGFIRGPGSGTSDSIPALLSNGEYVIKASAVRKIGKDQLDRLNSIDRFSEGGLIGGAGGIDKKPTPIPMPTSIGGSGTGGNTPAPRDWYGVPPSQKKPAPYWGLEQPKIGGGQTAGWLSALSSGVASNSMGTTWLERMGVNTKTEGWTKPRFQIPFFSEAFGLLSRVMGGKDGLLQPYNFEDSAFSFADLVNMQELPDLAFADTVLLDPNASLQEKAGMLLYSMGVLPGPNPGKRAGKKPKRPGLAIKERFAGPLSGSVGGDFVTPHSITAKSLAAGAGHGGFFTKAGRNDQKKMVENLVARYNDTVGEKAWIRDSGMRWYSDARVFLEQLLAQSGKSWDLDRAAAVLAALSGNTGWNQNMTVGRAFFDDPSSVSLDRPGVAAALRAMDADDPMAALGENADKWKNFAASILGVDIDGKTPVAVDRWAARAALGTLDEELAKKALKRSGGYDKIADAYRVAAEQLGISAEQLQAVTWMHIIKPRDNAMWDDIAKFMDTGKWSWAEDYFGATAPTPASLAREYTDQISTEFHNWIEEARGGKWPVGGSGPADYSKAMGGPLTYWDNIEAFLQERYPAAYRGFRYGEEEAAATLGGKRSVSFPPGSQAGVQSAYETGEEAVAKYGYDPKQIAAAMMYLHSDSHRGNLFNREDMLPRDMNLLADIFATRQAMQQQGILGGGGRFRSGGYISGPGSGTSDSIPALLSNGEYVIKASSVKKIGKERLDRLNSIEKFAPGGLVGNPLLPPMMNPPATQPTTEPVDQQTIPAPTPPEEDPFDLSNVPELTSDVAGSIVGGLTALKGAGSGGSAQSGAPRKKDPRSTLAAAPASSEHLNPAFGAAIKGVFSTAGAAAGTAIQAGVTAAVAGGSFGAAAPAAAAAGGQAASLVAAGAQAAGDVAAGVANVISALGVGTVSPAATGEGYGAPLLPQQQNQAVNNFQSIHNGNIVTNNLSEYSRLKDRKDAQKSAPFFNRVGA